MIIYVYVFSEFMKQYLYKNQIKEIPKEIVQLTYLLKLYLNENQIKEIPEEIAKMNNLRFLFLNKNPIVLYEKYSLLT